MSAHGPQRDALIALGSNLGDREATLVAAVKTLRSRAEISEIVASSIYETVPVGVLDQPKFLNAAIAITTSFTPEELLCVLLEIEHAFGRERRERWGPRTLDLDLLAYEREKRTTSDLMLPHPRMFERAFVMIPLRELLFDGRYIRANQWAELGERVLTAIESETDLPRFADWKVFDTL